MGSSHTISPFGFIGANTSEIGKHGQLLAKTGMEWVNNETPEPTLKKIKYLDNAGNNHC